MATWLTNRAELLDVQVGAKIRSRNASSQLRSRVKQGAWEAHPPLASFPEKNPRTPCLTRVPQPSTINIIGSWAPKDTSNVVRKRERTV